MCIPIDEPFVVPDKVVIFKITDEDHGVYVYIKDVVRDYTTKNRIGWIVTMIILIPIKGWKPQEATIKVNDEHLNGEPFTVAGEFRRFCKPNFDVSKIESKFKLIKGKEK